MVRGKTEIFHGGIADVQAWGDTSPEEHCVVITFGAAKLQAHKSGTRAYISPNLFMTLKQAEGLNEALGKAIDHMRHCSDRHEGPIEHIEIAQAVEITPPEPGEKIWPPK